MELWLYFLDLIRTFPCGLVTNMRPFPVRELTPATGGLHESALSVLVQRLENGKDCIRKDKLVPASKYVDGWCAMVTPNWSSGVGGGVTCWCYIKSVTTIMSGYPIMYWLTPVEYRMDTNIVIRGFSRLSKWILKSPSINFLSKETTMFEMKSEKFTKKFQIKLCGPVNYNWWNRLKYHLCYELVIEAAEIRPCFVLYTTSSGRYTTPVLKKVSIVFHCYPLVQHISVALLFLHVQETPEAERSSMYRSLVVNTSKEMMCFSDFPMPAHYPNYMHHSMFLNYLRLYAEHFDLLKYIHFQVIVSYFFVSFYFLHIDVTMHM